MAAEVRPGSDADRRCTWVIGGILLLSSAVVGLIARGPLAGIAYAQDVLWALGVLLLVTGVRSRPASVPAYSSANS